jgi:mRNA interferase MazF
MGKSGVRISSIRQQGDWIRQEHLYAMRRRNHPATTSQRFCSFLRYVKRNFSKHGGLSRAVDRFPAAHASVVICQMTSECRDAPDFRVTIDPSEGNGFRVKSQVKADKPVTIRRERIGRHIGHLDDKDVARLNIALAFAMGLAD